MKTRKIAVAVMALAIILTAGAAHAQGIGGGGGGYLQQVIQWFVTNIIQGLVMIGILIAGVTLMMGRHTVAGLAVMAVGAIVMTHYAEIAALFPAL
jgi:type IV secretory pathway VirB2 component (pilin)